jgi:hypothetical protein
MGVGDEDVGLSAQTGTIKSDIVKIMLCGDLAYT